MPANRVEQADAGKNPAGDKPRPEAADPGAPGEAGSNGAPAPKPPGGFGTWLPLLVTVVVMPALAYGMTTFVLLPKVQQAINAAGGEPSEESSKPDKSAAPAKAAHAKGGKEAAAKPKLLVPLSKVLVNVSGSMGTRYLLVTMTLVGTAPDFKEKVETNKDQLVDAAASALASKTIADLEKPGARNLIRAELISVFNNALGEGLVQEIYMTEFAIQ